jgi:hypothetical protein
MSDADRIRKAVAAALEQVAAYCDESALCNGGTGVPYLDGSAHEAQDIAALCRMWACQGKIPEPPK